MIHIHFNLRHVNFLLSHTVQNPSLKEGLNSQPTESATNSLLTLQTAIMRLKKALFTIVLIALCIIGKSQGFIENQGQWEEDFNFKAELKGGALFLEKNKLTFHLIDGSLQKAIHDRTIEEGTRVQHHAFSLNFIGANTDIQFETLEPSANYNNYYLGDDASRWKSKIYSVSTVIYRNLYKGVDLHVMTQGDALKYEFHLEAGVDPAIIQLEAEGVSDLHIDRDGNLVIPTSVQDIVELSPYIYQTKRDRKLEMNGGFAIKDNRISYSTPNYDPNLPLVIDPVISFSTFSGSNSDNWGYTAAPDKEGFLYAGGIVFGTQYPITNGAFDVTFNQGQYDIGITKYDTTGTSLIYSTYLGGSGLEHPHSMIVNDDGNLYVMGTTGSSNFPTTPGAINRTFSGGPSISIIYQFNEGVDLFVSAFNASGSAMLGSTYLGGSNTDGLNLSSQLVYNYSDEFRGEVNLDDDGNIYLATCTYSSDFPVTTGSFDNTFNSSQEGVAMSLNSSLTTIRWSGFLGGERDDAAFGIAVTREGHLFVAGGTNSLTFPATAGAFQSSFQGGRSDGFIARISSNGQTIENCSYYGSASYDQIYLLQLDRAQTPHFYGQSENPGTSLTFNANFSDPGGGQIVGVLNADLSDRIWTTQFGSTPGRPNISPTAFLVDVCNSVYLTGWGGQLNSSQSNNASDVGGLPTTNDAFQANPDNDDSDFYMAVLSADGNSLVFGSFYGGQITDDHVDGGTSRFDRGGKIYHSVCASCGGFDDFPVVPDPGAWSTTNNSNNCNNAVFKIDFELPIIVGDFNIPSFVCAPYTLNIQNNSITQTNTSFSWDFGNGVTSTLTNPSVTYTSTGIFDVTLVVSDPTSCNLFDTLVRSISVALDTNYELPDLVKCVGRSAILGPDPANYPNLGNATISWLPSLNLDNPNILNPEATVTNSTEYLCIIDYGGCQERIIQRLVIDRYPVDVSEDTIVCSTFDPFIITGNAPEDTATYEWSLNSDFINILSTSSQLLIETLTEPLNYFYFRATKNNGCQMMDTVLITVSDRDIELTPDTAFCKNQVSTINATSNNPLNTFDYYWTTNGFSTDTSDIIAELNQSSIEVLLDQADTFYLVAISNVVDGCQAQDSTIVTVSSLDFNDVLAYADQDTFYRGELVQLHGEPSSGNISFYWTPEQYISDIRDADPTVRPKEESSYIWVVTDNDVEECTFRDTVTISPYEIVCDTPEIYLPTAFSPNGDGINDELLVFGRNITSIELIIHDRWGKEVFRSNDQAIGWDGTFNGVPAEKAVYVYQLEALCITNQKYYTKGNVTIIE